MGRREGEGWLGGRDLVGERVGWWPWRREEQRIVERRLWGDREYEGEKMKGSGRKGGKKRKKGEVHVHACALACGSAFAFSGCVHVRFDQ